jgi:branched-subunit amino acid transport protein
MSRIMLIILACAAANYLLRVIPFFLSGGKIFHHILNGFLDYMPVVALGALIFPGIITSFPQNPAAGIAGVAAAAVAAWFFEGLILPVFASIGVTWFMLQYM